MIILIFTFNTNAENIKSEYIANRVKILSNATDLIEPSKIDESDCGNRTQASCTTYIANLTKEKIINEVRQLILSRLNLTHEPSIRSSERNNFRLLEDISKNIDYNQHEVVANKYVKKTKYDMLSSQTKLVKSIHEARGKIFYLI